MEDFVKTIMSSKEEGEEGKKEDTAAMYGKLDHFDDPSGRRIDHFLP